jgi:hypothetical protein
MNSMKSEAKSLVQDGKRKYAKTTLRVYGTVGEITSNSQSQKKSDGPSGMGIMTRTS